MVRSEEQRRPNSKNLVSVSPRSALLGRWAEVGFSVPNDETKKKKKKKTGRKKKRREKYKHGHMAMDRYLVIDKKWVFDLELSPAWRCI